MRILFDQGTPVPLRQVFTTHSVATAFERGWSTLSNGDLLAAAEREGFDLFVSTDQNLRYQQRIADRKLAVLVLPTTSWPVIRLHAAEITTALSRIRAGDFLELKW